jgi:4-coumarate--CoA ligase
MAYVTLSSAGSSYLGSRQTALKEIAEFVNAKVSPYKRLRGGVEVLDEVPKTPTGKILRRLLPARLARIRAAKL